MPRLRDGAGSRRAALMRLLRRGHLAPRLIGTAALVLVTAAASTVAVAATPSSSVAAHEAGGPIGPDLPPPAAVDPPPPEAPPPGDAAPSDFPTVDGTAPIDGTVPADTGLPADDATGLGDGGTYTGDGGTYSDGDGDGTGTGTSDVGTGTGTVGTGTGAIGPSGGGATAPTTPSTPAPPPAPPTPAQLCTQQLTPAYIARTFGVASNQPVVPTAPGNPTTCDVTSGPAPNPATVLTVVVTDPYTPQDQQRALSPLAGTRQVSNPVAFTTADGQRHLVWFQQKGQQRRMVEVAAPPGIRPVDPRVDIVTALDAVARFFTL